MPTQAEIEQHQEDTEELSALAVAEVAALVMASLDEGDEGRDRSVLVAAIRTVLQRYMVSAGQMAVAWYRGLVPPARGASSARVAAPPESIAPNTIHGPTGTVAVAQARDFRPRPAPLPPPEQIESTVWWALAAPDEPPESPEEPDGSVGAAPPEDADAPIEAAPPDQADVPDQADPDDDLSEPDDDQQARILPPREGLRAQVIPADATPHQARVISRLTGATQRYVTTAARDTVTQNADEEGVRWARHAKEDACAFCRLLATRGPDYLTAESAKRVVGRRGRPRGPRKIGELYHDDCQCEPVAVRAGDTYTPPEYVQAWDVQYGKAKSEVGSAAQLKPILREMRKLSVADGGSRH